jgi:hypothetical protein
MNSIEGSGNGMPGITATTSLGLASVLTLMSVPFLVEFVSLSQSRTRLGRQCNDART